MKKNFFVVCCLSVALICSFLPISSAAPLESVSAKLKKGKNIFAYSGTIEIPDREWDEQALKITGGNSYNSDIVKFYVYNGFGDIVQEGEIKPNSYNVVLSTIKQPKPGMYYLKVQCGEINSNQPLKPVCETDINMIRKSRWEEFWGYPHYNS